MRLPNFRDHPLCRPTFAAVLDLPPKPKVTGSSPVGDDDESDDSVLNTRAASTPAVG